MKRHNAKLADTTQPPALSNHGGFYFSPQRKQIMIHIENINITIDAQALSDEAETSHTLDVELLKAMVDSLSTKDEVAEEAEPEKQEEAQPTINAADLYSLQQQSKAWNAICKVLYEVCPDWMNAPGSAKQKAVEAIRAMAKAR